MSAAATVARDGGVQGDVKLDKNDRFCLAGSRLMVVNGKEYGADGAEYRKMDLILEMSYGTELSWVAPLRLLLQPLISTGATFKNLNWYDTGQPYYTTKIWTQDQEGNYIRDYVGPGIAYLDFNGDGQTDMIQVKDEQDGTPISVPPYQSIGGRGSLLQSVDNGLGSITSWTYKPLTDNTV